ncbi:MAG: hypothetical protein AB7U82_14510 [Blastocatellales bacterium]
MAKVIGVYDSSDAVGEARHPAANNLRCDGRVRSGGIHRGDGVEDKKIVAQCIGEPILNKI